MILNLLILHENKLITDKFSVKIDTNKVIINSLNNHKIIKVPIYNKINGINYYPISFPLELHIINNELFSSYILLSSLNIKTDTQFDYDFFNQISNKLNKKFMNYNDINIDKIKTIMNLNIDSLKEINNINTFISSFWTLVNNIKIIIIYSLIQNNINYKKRLNRLINKFKDYKYSLFDTNKNDFMMTLNEYYNFDNNNLNIKSIKDTNNYYIVKNSSESNKIVKINPEKLNNKNISYENYKWFYYYPNNIINNDVVLFQTFINCDFTKEIIKNILSIDNTVASRIFEYYNNNNLDNLIYLSNIFNQLKNDLEDFNILKSNQYSDIFFEYITKKNINKETEVIEILRILFNNYNFPLRNNRHDIENCFDYILYISFVNINIILMDKMKNFNDIINQNIISIIPQKLRNLYINMLKLYNHLLNNDFDFITYNQKFYSDYIYKNIIKIFLSDSNRLSIKYFKNSIGNEILNKFKNIVETNSILIDISNRLTWSNLSKRLEYLNIFYKNTNILLYQSKINKNIIPDFLDNRIRKIIENPFEMYKYLRIEKDFVKWTKFISEKVNDLYYNPISLSTEDLAYLGTLLYLLFNITSQNIKDISYSKFIEFCNSHTKLILDSNRINLKIKEHFYDFKTNINLGFLAKHLTWNREIITFEEPIEKSKEIIELEQKLNIMTKKYYKYKTKYIDSKNNITRSHISDTSVN